MKKTLPLLMLLPLILTACTNSATATGFLMDTVVTVDIEHYDAKRTASLALDTVGHIEGTLSAHLDYTEVARFNRGERTEPSDTFLSVMKTAVAVSKATDGAYDVTVAPIVGLWDVTAEDFTPPSDEEIAALMPLVGYERLTVTDTSVNAEDGVTVDLGGIGKGYACGFASDYLEDKNAVGTVNIGGNVAVVGEKEGGFRIGIKDPFSPQELCGVLTVESGIIAVSGGYERYGEYGGVRYHHIIDPKTGRPAKTDLESVAVWVEDNSPESGALSDALSTALFIIGKDEALRLYESGQFAFEAILIGKDGELTLTDGIRERFERLEK